MSIFHTLLKLSTDESIGFYNITESVQQFINTTNIKNGQVIVFSRHTTTALVINEDETRLLEDIKTYLTKLAPPTDAYLHNDLHLRDVPPDEPENAHSHLMAMTLSTSEIIPIVDGKLALGTYQSLMLVELDGPRQRTVFVQVCGES
ncbi:MAG: secondary thiamine-phosphate synthase enzyme YjbQ [Crocosphaera sp.]|nr:secondary thiamine-phosphate synthase enzyme YjbQ [Crocosphaera sp.]